MPRLRVSGFYPEFSLAVFKAAGVLHPVSIILFYFLSVDFTQLSQSFVSRASTTRSGGRLLKLGFHMIAAPYWSLGNLSDKVSLVQTGEYLLLQVTEHIY